MKTLPVLAFGLVLLAFSAVSGQAADRLVIVTGEATVAVAPDMAVIRVGVTSAGKTAREASDINARQMTAVLAAIKDAGIGARDIQTSPTKCRDWNSWCRNSRSCSIRPATTPLPMPAARPSVTPRPPASNWGPLRQ
jgi:hypothetical protein